MQDRTEWRTNNGGETKNMTKGILFFPPKECNNSLLIYRSNVSSLCFIFYFSLQFMNLPWILICISARTSSQSPSIETSIYTGTLSVLHTEPHTTISTSHIQARISESHYCHYTLLFTYSLLSKKNNIVTIPCYNYHG